MVYIVTGVGICCSIMYLIGIPEARLTRQAKYYDEMYQRKKKELEVGGAGDPLLPNAIAETMQEDTLETSDAMEDIKRREPDGKSIGEWLKEGSFYMYGLIYMFARMVMNLSMSIQPFYAIYVLKVSKEEDEPNPPFIALVPLASFICSAAFSLLIYKRMVQYFGNRSMPLLIGAIVITIGSVPYIFMQPSFKWLIFVCAGIQGIGIGTLVNTSTSIISDMIGTDNKNSAFVYGFYSLMDKISSGILLTLISVSIPHSRDT